MSVVWRAAGLLCGPLWLHAGGSALVLGGGSGVVHSVCLAGACGLSLVGPTGVQLLDFCCSSISELVCC